MFVTKRNGKIEEVQFDKITKRINKLVKPEEKKFIDPILISQKVVGSIFPGITTEELDIESANTCINLCTSHHLYSSLAGRILVSNLHKKTLNTFVEKQELIEKELGILDIKWLEWIKLNRDKLNLIIDYEKDYIFDYFGFKTLERAYLIKIGNTIIERPQDMFLRVASFINCGDLEMIEKTYNLMANGYYTHASPTLFNSGNKRSQLSSCFEANTLVDTLNGPIKIKDVKVGDQVITHLGNIKKVVQVHQNLINNRKLYKVTITDTKQFIATQDHKLYIYNMNMNRNEWKTIENLSDSDFIMTPKYNGFIDNPEIVNKEFEYMNHRITVNNLVMFFFGYWLSNGDFIISDNKIEGIKVYNLQMMKELSILKIFLGIENVQIDLIRNEILYLSPKLGNLFNEIFKDKKLPSFFYKLKKELIENFINGINLSNLTPELYTLTKLYDLFPTDQKFTDDNHFNYLQFKSLEEVIIEDEYVYTLGVENDHSYSICGIIAQNCFLLGTDDSLEGITKTWGDVAKISKWGGGIGLHVSNIRAKDTIIKSTNGPSSGIIPMLKVYNEIARYIDQCFTGNVKIFTSHGLIPIERIKPNDQVLTFDGSYQEVERVYSDIYNGLLYKLDYNCYVTPEHPFMVLRNNLIVDNKNKNNKHIFNNLINKLKLGLIEEQWTPIKDFSINDFIKYPIPKYEKDNLNLDETDCYIYGLLFVNKKIMNNKYILENLNIEQKNTVINYLNLNMLKYEEVDDNILWSISSKFKFVKYQFIYFDYNLLHLPLNKLKWLLKGLLENNTNINHFSLLFKTQDETLIPIIKSILLRFSILATINTDFSNIIHLIIPKTELMCDIFNTKYAPIDLDYFEYNGSLYSHVKIYEKIEINNIIVYDLEIKNNHNYVTELGIVHNGGKRKGSIAIYLEPHHPDILAFLDLKKNFGTETERARDLFLAVWISDLFMKQVESDGDWYLLCPNKCPGLSDVYGQDYENLFWSYVDSRQYNKKVKARDVMKAILDSQLETGTPYITYKDNVNHKSNQKNVGTIKSSNLCVDGETLLLTNEGNIKISNLKDQTVTIWNGFEWSEVIVKQTGVNQKLIKVLVIPYKNNTELSIRVLFCTSNHKFYVETSENIVDAYDLKLGYKLIGYNDSDQLLFESYDYAVVIGIENYGSYGDTYCLTEPKRHMAIFNGILTGQCNEIVEYSDHEEYAVCNLASIALNKFVKQFEFNYKSWTIYTKDNCKYCTFAKNFLNNKGIKYNEIKNSLPIIENKIINTYPQIFIDDFHIGGYSELYEYTKGTFDYEKLYDVAYTATINLDKVIDINYYPVIEAKKSNIRHRPIGLGIQGLADALVLLKINFDSNESIQLNKKIMETIYLAAMTASNDIAIRRTSGINILIDYILPEYYDNKFIIEDTIINNLYHDIKPNRMELIKKVSSYSGAYSTFKGSPISKGIFQFDMWSLDRDTLIYKDKWEKLQNKIIESGVRNSLVTALMPTASTSQILGNNECFEFYTNNIYTRRTLAGDFPLVNKYLIDELINVGLWSNEMKQMIIANNGSIQSFSNIPEQIRKQYKTIWEIKQIWVLKNALARSPFVDQTQSMNIFMDVPNYQKLYSSHFWAWKNGLKTGIYYLRSKPSKQATKITVDPTIEEKIKNFNDEICENCSA